MSLAEEASNEDEVEIAEKFLQPPKLENTHHKTNSDLNACKKFYELLKESRGIENIPVNELDLLFDQIFHIRS